MNADDDAANRGGDADEAGDAVLVMDDDATMIHADGDEIITGDAMQVDDDEIIDGAAMQMDDEVNIDDAAMPMDGNEIIAEDDGGTDGGTDAGDGELCW